MISVFVHDRVALAEGKGADVVQLLLDGNIALAGGGIAGIGDRGTRGAGWNSVLLFHNQCIRASKGEKTSIVSTSTREPRADSFRVLDVFSPIFAKIFPSSRVSQVPT